jgi:hypothetical protein
MSAPIRMPAVAGQFYPGKREVLERDAKALRARDEEARVFRRGTHDLERAHHLAVLALRFGEDLGALGLVVFGMMLFVCADGHVDLLRSTGTSGRSA